MGGAKHGLIRDAERDGREGSGVFWGRKRKMGWGADPYTIRWKLERAATPRPELKSVYCFTS